MGQDVFNVMGCYPTSDPAFTAATGAVWPPGAEDINCQKLHQYYQQKDQVALRQQFMNVHNVKLDTLEFSTAPTAVASAAKLA